MMEFLIVAAIVFGFVGLMVLEGDDR